MNTFIQLLEEAQQNQSGFSFNPTTNQVNPKSGYMVSSYGHEMACGKEALMTSGIQYYQEHKNTNVYIGCWFFDDMYYFDISENVQNLETAMTLATHNMQLAIWDCANNQALYTSVRECECCGKRTTYGYVFQDGDHYTCDEEACRDHVALNEYDTTWDELVNCDEAEKEFSSFDIESSFYYSEFSQDSMTKKVIKHDFIKLLDRYCDAKNDILSITDVYYDNMSYDINGWYEYVEEGELEDGDYSKLELQVTAAQELFRALSKLNYRFS